MNWLSLIMQFLSLRKSLVESKALIEAAEAMAERGKRFLLSFLGIFFAAIFFFSALIVAVIEFGLQLERDSGVSYSGLMISATILFFIGFFLTIFSLILGFSHRSPPKRKEPEPSREDQLKVFLEEFLLTFLTQLASGKSEKPVAPKRSE